MKGLHGKTKSKLTVRVYKTELDLNNVQITECLQHAGTARYAFNWGLSKKIKAHKQKLPYPTAISLHKELNALKSTEFPWMYDVSKCAPQEALFDLDKAFDNFFRRCADPKIRKKGFTKFKSKKKRIGAFRLNGIIRATDKTIQLPRLGELRLKEHGYFPTAPRIVSATVSEKAGHWFISITTDEPPVTKPIGTETLGVDVGIETLATLSDGTTKFENPRAYRNAEKKIKKHQKRVSRKAKGSNNRRKAKRKLARAHYRASCVRNDSIHKATTAITKRAGILGIELLNVQGMLKNHCLAKAIQDAGFYEFRRQIEYKMKRTGGKLITADRWYPSSKTCSRCGVVKEKLDLSERIFKCDSCGLVIGRDLNAAINLKKLAESEVTGSSVRPVRSDFKPVEKPALVLGLSSQDQLISMNQEPNTI
jgi:putative transposase